VAGGRAPTRRLNRGLESGEYLLREWYAPNLAWLRMALNELGARHLNCRAMSLYHSQPPADYGDFGEFNGFSFRHYLANSLRPSCLRGRPVLQIPIRRLRMAST
jgi:hypothetical protein